MGSQSKDVREDANDLPFTFSSSVQANDENTCSETKSVFKILHVYQRQIQRLHPDNKLNSLFKSRKAVGSNREVTSAQCIMNIARTKLLHQDKADGACSSNSKVDLAKDDNLKDVELAISLLVAAEKVSVHDFEPAEKLLRQCALSASRAANPIQRVVLCFTEALKERIDKERHMVDLERRIGDVEDFVMKFTPVLLAYELKLPFTQITHFTAMQAILDNVGSSRKIHLIDLSVKSGSHCIIFMQGLANLKDRDAVFDSIKITTVGTSTNRIEQTGKYLSSFAESLSLPFSFNIVVSEMQDLRKEFFEVEEDESVMVFVGLRFGFLLDRPNQLEKFTNFVKELKPVLMVSTDIEADTNTEVFIDRFHEVITLTCAAFDCLEECLDGDLVMYRKILETFYFAETIRDIVAAGDEERRLRHAKVEFWRKYFGGSGIVEKELSKLCFYQAELMLNTNSCWSACSVDLDGGCMIVKWNGTPMQSVSCWRFKEDRNALD